MESTRTMLRHVRRDGEGDPTLDLAPPPSPTPTGLSESEIRVNSGYLILAGVVATMFLILLVYLNVWRPIANYCAKAPKARRLDEAGGTLSREKIDFSLKPGAKAVLPSLWLKSLRSHEPTMGRFMPSLVAPRKAPWPEAREAGGAGDEYEEEDVFNFTAAWPSRPPTAASRTFVSPSPNGGDFLDVPAQTFFHMPTEAPAPTHAVRASLLGPPPPFLPPSPPKPTRAVHFGVAA